MVRSNTNIRRAAQRRLIGAGLIASVIAIGSMPSGQAAEAHSDRASIDYGGSSYYPIKGDGDVGGLGAFVSGDVKGTGQVNDYLARFEPAGEKLVLEDNLTDGHKLEAEVRVYRHADADGGPYDQIDRDHFVVGWHETKNLGTPDGSGNIKEGRYVAIRIRVQGTSAWSEWEFGKA